MDFRQGNYFNLHFEEKFPCIIKDPEWKGCFKDQLGENTYTVDMLMAKTDADTTTDACLIIFTNYRFSIDLITASLKTQWHYHTYQIWNKEPVRNWITWSMPLRTTEFILYFVKGDFKLSFKNGTVSDGYNRSSFGGKLKNTKHRENTVSYSMYSEIVSFPPVTSAKRIHPHEKPKAFSAMFLKITGDKPVLDPFCGSGNLLAAYTHAVGVDLVKYPIAEGSSPIASIAPIPIQNTNFDEEVYF